MMNTTQSSVPTTLTLLIYKLSINSNLIGLDLYLIMFTTVYNFKNDIGSKHQVIYIYIKKNPQKQYECAISNNLT